MYRVSASPAAEHQQRQGATHHFVIINFTNGSDHGVHVDDGWGIHTLHTGDVT